ncbi:MAG TPA: NIPSNAP family protein [Micromonosporaceae bacterium]|jgi:hypothetical protein
MSDDAVGRPGLFELRFYTAYPGKRDELARYMDEVVIPFNTARGVQVVASFVDEENEDVYVWIRRFADEADRKDRYRAIYGDPEWTDVMGPVITDLMILERAVVTRAIPTAGSLIR